MSEFTKVKDIWGHEHYARKADLADRSIDLILMRDMHGMIKRFRHKHLLQDVRIKRQNIAKIW